MAKPITIYFEDHGQDFLEWDIDPKSHKIVGCRPRQADLWVGVEVADTSELKEGSKPTFFTRHANYRFRVKSKYPITKIEGTV